MARMSWLACALMSLGLGLGGTASAPVLAQAAQPPDPRTALPERPTIATHAHTIAPGYVEIEAGIQGLHPKTGETEYDTPSLVKIGLSRHLQLDIFEGVSAAFNQSGQSSFGLGDVSGGFKWRPLDAAPVVGDFAVQATVKFPTGSAETGSGTGTTDFSLTLISSHDLSGVSLDINVGYTIRSGDGTNVPTRASLWTTSLGLPVRGPIGWAAEVFGYPGTTGPAGARPIVGFLTGPTFTIRRYLVADCGGIIGISGDLPAVVYAGLVWNIGSLVPRHGARLHR